MLLTNLVNKIQATQEKIINECNAMNNDKIINTQSVIECCGFLNTAIKNINEGESLTAIKGGFEHALHLFGRINRIVAACEDTENAQALSIYMATNLSSDVKVAINNFIK